MKARDVVSELLNTEHELKAFCKKNGINTKSDSSTLFRFFEQKIMLILSKFAGVIFFSVWLLTPIFSSLTKSTKQTVPRGYTWKGKKVNDHEFPQV